MSVIVKQLKPGDEQHLYALMNVFADAFEDKETYNSNRPSEAYLTSLLGKEYFITLVAIMKGQVIGGLVAYELKKFEQQHSEIYLYDLAVQSNYRRRGIATALIEQLKTCASERCASTIYVQAETTEDDAAAIELYSKLGHKNEVLHFDIKLHQ